MRAALVHRFGSPEDITVEDRPPPAAQAGEVLVQIHAAGVNYADVLMVAGRYQIRPPLPFVPGLEFCGVVTEVGAGVQRWQPGDRVMGAPIRGGCFAEQVAVPAGQLFHAPESLPLELAAQFVVAYGTAAFAYERAGLKRGETVLVSGAAGGVGIAAIAIAQRLGARVIAAAGSEEKLRIAKSHGAHQTIDYTVSDVRETVLTLTEGRGVDVVLDTVGGRFFDEAIRATARRGRILVVGFASGSFPRVAAEYLLVRNLSVIGIGFGGILLAEPDAVHRVIDELRALHAAEPFTPQIGGRFSLEQVPTALRRLADRAVIGKQLVLP